jgi:ATP-dependent RNA helicase RhlE
LSFDIFGLDPRILDGVRAAGYTKPTPIQRQAIPEVMAGRDVLGVAQTGTGKTAAFALPILQRLLDGPRGRTRALIIAPTRELAEQIHGFFHAMTRRTGLRSATVYGGVGRASQAQALRRGTEIIVACPGRLLDHMGEGDADLSGIEILVLDEADRMCDMGFLPDVKRILRELPVDRQTLFFSATMPMDIRGLADRILRNPLAVQVDTIAPAATVAHSIYPTTDRLRKSMLETLLRREATGRTLVFTRTKHRARSLAHDLERSGMRVAELQGNMPQSKRQQAIDGFRSGRYDILVATDIAARGIDVTAVKHVINYDAPDTVDAYTHRIGRTGRAQLTGEAFTLVDSDDSELIERIEKTLGVPLERRRIDGFDYGAFTPETALNPVRRAAASGRSGGGGRRRAPTRMKRFG